ncbi:MAG: molybdopterin-guanine dinucleotide biosynthesis protein B [Candidatus Brocadiaceae bacterium]
MPKEIFVVSIVGKQNVGKTTLIGVLIPLLKRKGYRVGTIKYNIPSFEIDYEGKDTYNHYKAGADVVSISSPEKLAVIKRLDKKSPTIKDIINRYYQGVDIVLVEGYKNWRYPYVEIHKDRSIKSSGKEFKHHITIVSSTTTDSPIPGFHKNDLNTIIKFIESKIK